MTINLKEQFSKQKITHNLPLKILSLIIAIGLWFLVVGITDPVIKHQYTNVSVRIINTSLITDADKTIEILDSTEVLDSVVIRAPRSVIGELGDSTDSIVAVADVANLSSDKQTIPIAFSTTKYNDKVESIKGSESVVRVKIENKKTIQIPLTATTSGSIESGYVVGDITLGQNQIKISGPESVIDTIKSALIDVEITGFTENISTQADIVLYNAAGEVVSQNNLELNATSVRANVEILATKRVPVKYKTMGTVADGYAVTGEIECYPESVIIAGSKNSIMGISSVDIPATEVNLTGQTSNFIAVLNVPDYLPEGIRLVDSVHNGRITITVFVEKILEETYASYLRNVVIDHIPDGFDAEFKPEEESISFVLKGLAQYLENVQMSTFNLRVDFSDYALANNIDEFTEGEYNLSLVMDLPEGVELADTVTIPVELFYIRQHRMADEE